MGIPDNLTDREMQKFIETSDGKVAVRLTLHSDSYDLLDDRYVLIGTSVTVQDSTETSNAATQLNALLAQLRLAGLLSPTT